MFSPILKLFMCVNLILILFTPASLFWSSTSWFLTFSLGLFQSFYNFFEQSHHLFIFCSFYFKHVWLQISQITTFAATHLLKFLLIFSISFSLQLFEIHHHSFFDLWIIINAFLLFLLLMLLICFYLLEVIYDNNFGTYMMQSTL